MAGLYLVADAGEIARRRRLLAPGRIVETWPDLYTRGEFWMGQTSKAALDETGTPLPAALSIAGDLVPVYYGPRPRDTESLPLEESLRSRVLSAHGLAVACITRDRLGERITYEPAGPADPVFYLRRPASTVAHVWRLFRNRREARVYLAEHCGNDPEGREWADRLPAETFAELLERHAVRE